MGENKFSVIFDLLVEGNEPRLASLLKESCQHVRRHLPLRAADAVEIPVRAFMHEKTFRDFHLYDRLFVVMRVRDGKLVYQRRDRWLDGIVADVPQPCLHDVKLALLDAFYLFRLVIHAKHKCSAVGGGLSLSANAGILLIVRPDNKDA